MEGDKECQKGLDSKAPESMTKPSETAASEPIVDRSFLNNEGEKSATASKIPEESSSILEIGKKKSSEEVLVSNTPEVNKPLVDSSNEVKLSDEGSILKTETKTELAVQNETESTDMDSCKVRRNPACNEESQKTSESDPQDTDTIANKAVRDSLLNNTKDDLSNSSSDVLVDKQIEHLTNEGSSMDEIKEVCTSGEVLKDDLEGTLMEAKCKDEEVNVEMDAQLDVPNKDRSRTLSPIEDSVKESPTPHGTARLYSDSSENLSQENSHEREITTCSEKITSNPEISTCLSPSDGKIESQVAESTARIDRVDYQTKEVSVLSYSESSEIGSKIEPDHPLTAQSEEARKDKKRHVNESPERNEVMKNINVSKTSSSEECQSETSSPFKKIKLSDESSYIRSSLNTGSASAGIELASNDLRSISDGFEAEVNESDKPKSPAEIQPSIENGNSETNVMNIGSDGKKLAEDTNNVDLGSDNLLVSSDVSFKNIEEPMDVVIDGKSDSTVSPNDMNKDCDPPIIVDRQLEKSNPESQSTCKVLLQENFPETYQTKAAIEESFQEAVDFDKVSDTCAGTVSIVPRTVSSEDINSNEESGSFIDKHFAAVEKNDEIVCVEKKTADEDAATIEDKTIADESTADKNSATMENKTMFNEKSTADKDSATREDKTIVDESTADKNSATIEDKTVVNEKSTADEDFATIEDRTIVDESTADKNSATIEDKTVVNEKSTADKDSAAIENKTMDSKENTGDEDSAKLEDKILNDEESTADRDSAAIEDKTMVDERTTADKNSATLDVNVTRGNNTDPITTENTSIAVERIIGDTADTVTTLSEKNSAATVQNSGNVEDQGTGTSGKISSVAEGDEELCIVPDTEPRVVTDKEKAEAFEKVNKAVGVGDSAGQSDESRSDSTDANICQGSEIKESVGKEVLNTTERDKGAADSDKNVDASKRDSDKNVDTSKRKFSIQLKSTSSLVSMESMASNENVREGIGSPQQSELDHIRVEESSAQLCANCSKVTKCKYKLSSKENVYLCEDECYSKYRKDNETPVASSTKTASTTIRARKLDCEYARKCGQCSKKVDVSSEKALTWETMDFCSDECLEKYQKDLGSCCANCKGPVQSASLGKYCVRFGHDMKQFCRAPCLEDFKKGLKVCSYCQRDISNGVEGFLAPVGDKGQFKDFCTQECMEKYDQMSNNTAPPEIYHDCAVCNNLKVVKVQVLIDSKVQKLCSEPCFAAFKFVNAVTAADQCDMCKKYFDRNQTENFTVFYDDAPHSFCCKTCMNVYILAKRKIVPCTYCKVKKYNFDMIKKTKSNGRVIMMCSLHCFNLYQVASGSTKQMKCEHCNSATQSQYHLTMSDATLRSFCSYNCVASFQAKFVKAPMSAPGVVDKTPHPLGLPRKIAPKRPSPVTIPSSEKETISSPSSMPVISSVTSLAPPNGLMPSSSPTLSPPITMPATTKGTTTEPVKTVYKQQFIIRPPVHAEMTNCAVQVKPMSATKSISCKPFTCSVETQTDDTMPKPIVIPVPVPIYIPTPMHMYSSPYPVPVPIVLPIPVPIFIPTTRNSAKGIFKEIKRIQDKIPSDPYEAELLMMAEMVAGEKKKADNTDTESEDGDASTAADDANEAEVTAEPDYNAENVDTSNTFGDDVLQMALKMASELDEPPVVDFEATVTPSTITQTAPTQTPQPVEQNDESEGDDVDIEQRCKSGRKRTSQPTARSPSASAKRTRKSSTSDQSNVTSTTECNITIKSEPMEKPDANMCLKFTFGVNAWKNWVNQKNADLEKSASATRKIKPFKTDLLQLTADELNYSLCLFVKEVRKPNGTEYAPDTIYYLCLGIQQYLIENGRVENIFSDPYYEKFTDCLDEVAKQFSHLYSDSQFLVTRIEEEHLWESKQLGAHSPYVLLSTLMFFNTKYFNLTTVDEHMQLSFSHIMKHWKRNSGTPSSGKSPGSRNVLLRFYPPQAALAANSKKKKVYEQQENEDNPLRCPVKLYEFYLSKCPESVKTRNDVFYLLPERSCVPDSPVWYSTMALGNEQLQKMLHRIKLVKEIVMI